MFSVVASGTGPFTYQWSKDGKAIAGANAATYSIAVVGNTDVGRYSVSVANAVGAVLSQEAELVIVTAPSILIQPTAVNTTTASSTRSYRARYFGFNHGPEGWSAVPWSGKDLEWPTSGWYWNDQIDEGLTESNLEGAAGGGETVSPLISLVGLVSPELRFRVGTTGAFAIHVSTDKTNWAPLFNIPAGAVTSNDPISVSLAAFAGSSRYLRFTSTSGTWLDEVEIWGTGLAKEIVELSVATQGEGLTYQWYKDGVAITGATSRGYVIADATVSTTAGSYTVKISNAAGSVTSSAAKVGVLPLVSSQPASAYKALGQPVSFSVSVSGVGPFTYQWRKDGIPIPGATASAYSIASVGVASAGSYAVSVSNAVGSVLSQSASLQIVTTPAISTQPSSQGYVAKIPQTYRVRYFGFGSGPDGWSVSTTETAFYQNWGQPGWYWNPYHDEIPANPLAANLEGGFGGVVTSPWISLIGVTTPELRFTCMSSAAGPIAGPGTLSIQTSADGTNWVTAFSKTNDSAMTSHAINLAAYAGTGCYIRAVTSASCNAYLDEVEIWGYGTPSNSATFTISASGGGLSYQWYKDGLAIAGATASTYSVADVYATGAVGLYSVRVTNAAGTTASTAAILAIIPAITTQPVALVKVAGQPAVFSVVATGTGPLTYQWHKGGAAISGATSSTYNIAAVGAQHVGTYSVTISNALGQTTSQPIALSVALPPTIITQPASYMVPAETKALNTVVKYDFNMGEQGWAFGSNAANAAATAWFFGWDDPTQVNGLVECDNFSGQYADLYARSPWISLAGVDLPSLSFTADFYGSSGSLSVEASKDGVSWVALKDPLPAYGSYDYASSYLADLSDYVLTGVYLRVRLRGTNFAGVIDNWEVKGYKYPSGQSRVLSVTATGSGNSFQWFRNGLAIAGATNSSYVITDCYAAASLGSYTATVSNAVGTVTSAAAVVSVALPAITSQPQSYSGSWPSSAREIVLSNGFSLGAEGWGPVGAGYPGWLWNDQRFESPTDPTASSLEGNGYIKSPLVSLAGVTGASVDFDIQAYGGTCMLDASVDGVTWSSLYSYNSSTATGGTKTVSLSAYSGKNVYLRFYMPATGAALLDNVEVSGYSKAYTMTAIVSGVGCSYQWYKNGVAISGATASTYRVSDVALAASAGSYTVKVTNAAGSVTSNAAVVPAFAAPVITSQPSSLSVLGSTYVPYTVKNYTFTYGAEGWTYGSNLGNQAAYHWDWDSITGGITDRLYGSYYASYTDSYTQSPWISLLGVTSPVLYFTASHDLYPDALDVLEVQASSDGVYWATLRSIYGNGSGVYSVSLAGYQWAGCYIRYRLRSSPLYNAYGITIFDTVVSGTVVSLGQSAGFSIGLSASAGCTFQWYKNNVAISGANSSSYYIANAYASDAGAYKVIVTNPVGSVTSASATLTVR
jgi:membrane carboxypeptidase/penicillin-binding protein PbpC